MDQNNLWHEKVHWSVLSCWVNFYIKPFLIKLVWVLAAMVLQTLYIQGAWSSEGWTTSRVAVIMWYTRKIITRLTALAFRCKKNNNADNNHFDFKGIQLIGVLEVNTGFRFVLLSTDAFRNQSGHFLFSSNSRFLRSNFLMPWSVCAIRRCTFLPRLHRHGKFVCLPCRSLSTTPVCGTSAHFGVLFQLLWQPPERCLIEVEGKESIRRCQTTSSQIEFQLIYMRSLSEWLPRVSNGFCERLFYNLGKASVNWTEWNTISPLSVFNP